MNKSQAHNLLLKHDPSLAKDLKMLEAFKNIATMKGEPGHTPIKGKDYFTENEVNQWLRAITPVKGVHYFTDSEIQSILDVLTPKKGIHYFDGKDGKGIPGTAGRDGKDATVDYDLLALKVSQLIPQPENGKDAEFDLESASEAIVRYIKENKILHIADLKGYERFAIDSKKPRKSEKFDMSDQRWHGASTSSGTAANPQVPSGTINGVNVTFSISGTISALFLNSGFQMPSGVDYTLSNTTITFVNPPPSGSTMFAI